MRHRESKAGRERARTRKKITVREGKEHIKREREAESERGRRADRAPWITPALSLTYFPSRVYSDQTQPLENIQFHFSLWANYEPSVQCRNLYIVELLYI